MYLKLDVHYSLKYSMNCVLILNKRPTKSSLLVLSEKESFISLFILIFVIQNMITTQQVEFDFEEVTNQVFSLDSLSEVVIYLFI